MQFGNIFINNKKTPNILKLPIDVSFGVSELRFLMMQYETDNNTSTWFVTPAQNDRRAATIKIRQEPQSRIGKQMV